MENEIQIFSHPKFGTIRMLMKADGSLLFCGNDAANALGYSNQRDAINRHCKGVVKRDIPTTSGVQSMNFISEGDLYRLAAKSELPSANEFENWIFDEVLPSIRKTGAYGLPSAPPLRYPHKSSSLGEAARIIMALDKIMVREKHLPEAMAEMAKGICDFCEIPLPDNFVKHDPYIELTLVGFVQP